MPYPLLAVSTAMAAASLVLSLVVNRRLQRQVAQLQQRAARTTRALTAAKALADSVEGLLAPQPQSLSLRADPASVAPN